MVLYPGGHMLTFAVVGATRTEGGVKHTGWIVERRGPRLKSASVTVLIENENEAWEVAERIAKAERGLVAPRPRGLKP